MEILNTYIQSTESSYYPGWPDLVYYHFITHKNLWFNLRENHGLYMFKPSCNINTKQHMDDFILLKLR